MLLVKISHNFESLEHSSHHILQGAGVWPLGLDVLLLKEVELPKHGRPSIASRIHTDLHLLENGKIALKKLLLFVIQRLQLVTTGIRIDVLLS